MPAYANMDNVEVVAICDIKPDKAKKLADQYGVAQTFENYQELLALPGLDAVDICTPNYLHSIIAVEALDKGLRCRGGEDEGCRGKEWQGPDGYAQ